MITALSSKFLRTICLVIFLCGAQSAFAYDVTGQWILSPVGAAPQTLNLTQSGTALSGNGSVGSAHWTYDGQSSVIGSAVTLHYVYQGISYNGFYNGTLSDNDHMSGTSVDSNNAVGSFTAARVGSTPDGGGQTGAGGGTTGSHAIVTCLRGPNASDDFVCTASVGSTLTNPVAPTGTVHWTLDRGAFRYGSDCQLRNDPAHGTTSYCSITWIPGSPVLNIGDVVPVDALYKGDSVYQTAASVRPQTNVVRPSTTPLVCISRTQANCEGLNVESADVSFTDNTSGYIDFAAYTAPEPYVSAYTTARSTSTSLKAPKRVGDIAFEVTLTVKSSNNKFLKTLPAVQKFSVKLAQGMTVSSAKGTLAYAAKKRVVLKLTSDAKKVFAAAKSSNHTTLKASLVIKVIRKGDKQPKTFTKVSVLTL